nr:uncharacterized protein I303_08495 [Kwoniella dejecticola CBS 10117]OBR81112.1 hypothetical protein I303_08495 [Kwoniella dejecticola CBS 10117]
MATDSSYTFNTCVNTNALWPPADAFPEDAYRAGLLDTPEECLATCKQYPVAAIQPDTIKNQYNCFCGSDTSFTYTSTGACQEYQYFTYQHTANTAVSSQFAKRQLKERMLRLQGDKHALCPGGLTACKVSGAEDSFECIDTSSELESCGGCAHGAFNANQTSFGFDCTRLEGVAAGAVTCSRGKCESYKCLPEFRLAANGTCIAA